VHTNGQVDLVPADAGPPALELLEDLRGRPAVVTGAARGIGEAIAKWLIGAGADVTVIDKDPDALKDAFRTEDCQVIEADLHTEDAAGLADELTRNGPVELLVNNVGVTTPHRLLEIGPRSSSRATRSSPADRTARRASSSCSSGTPKAAMKPSPWRLPTLAPPRSARARRTAWP